MTEKDYRMIMVGRGRVGMTGLETIFKKLAADGRKPSHTLGNELVDLAGNRNYIAPSSRYEYAKALLAEYRRYLGEDLSEEFSGLSIKILGPGCPRCEALTSNVMSALAELQMPGDIEHVRESAQVRQYDVTGTPALVANGKVMTVGRVPSVEQIKKMLR